jgi:hypothetical protein
MVRGHWFSAQRRRSGEPTLRKTATEPKLSIVRTRLPRTRRIATLPREVDLRLYRRAAIGGDRDDVLGVLKSNDVRDQRRDADPTGLHCGYRGREFLVGAERAAQVGLLRREQPRRHRHVTAEAGLHDDAPRAHGKDGRGDGGRRAGAFSRLRPSAGTHWLASAICSSRNAPWMWGYGIAEP